MTDRPTQCSPAARIQWPTFALLAVCYIGIATVTYFAAILSYFVAIPLLSVLLALHSSLQHELLHGNPFKQAGLNDLMGFPAVGLFIPYLRFKTTHLAHHQDEHLTDPYDDPESQYLDPATWQRKPQWLRRIYRFNNTLLGRMLIGPIIGTWDFYRGDLKAAVRGDKHILQAYGLHALGIALASLWFIGVANWSIGAWLLAAYGALSLLRVRTFLEHKASPSVDSRTAIVNDRGPFAWIFLFNNLHTVHHKHPRLPWYLLPACYEKHQDYFDKLNNHYHYSSYWLVFKHYFFTAKDPVPHPLLTPESRSKSHTE